MSGLHFPSPASVGAAQMNLMSDSIVISYEFVIGACGVNKGLRNPHNGMKLVILNYKQFDLTKVIALPNGPWDRFIFFSALGSILT